MHSDPPKLLQDSLDLTGGVECTWLFI